MLNCFHTCMCINGVQYDFYYLFVRLFNYKPSIFFIAAFTLKGNPVNSKYKSTFVLIELHSFLVKEIFDFVNHSPVFFTNLLITIFLVWAILQKWFSDYETWSELGTSYDTSSITTALVYCLSFFSTIHAVYYIYYPVSIQCFVKYLVSCHLWIKFLRSLLNCLVIEIRYLPIKS